MCLRGHDCSVTCLPHCHAICALVVWDRADDLPLRIGTANTIELHLSWLIGTASHLDMQKNPDNWSFFFKKKKATWAVWSSTLTVYSMYLRLNGPGSVVGIATAYGLDGPGIESRWARFSAPVQTYPEAHQASCTMGTGSFPVVRCGQGRDADPSPPSSAEVKNRVELYLYSP